MNSGYIIAYSIKYQKLENGSTGHSNYLAVPKLTMKLSCESVLHEGWGIF